jgi:ABC-type uncharacterized transport system permease subunit
MRQFPDWAFSEFAYVAYMVESIFANILLSVSVTVDSTTTGVLLAFYTSPVAIAFFAAAGRIMFTFISTVRTSQFSGIVVNAAYPQDTSAKVAMTLPCRKPCC